MPTYSSLISTSLPSLNATLADGLLWPCTLRYSARVKRVKISVDSQGFVELILPQNSSYNELEVQAFLDSMSPWLQKTLDALLPRPLQAQRALQCLQKLTNTLTRETLPTSITLPVFKQTWTVSLQAKRGGYAKLREGTSVQQGQSPELLLYATETEIRSCCKLLQKWLMEKSNMLLPQMTQDLAKSLHLRVGKVSIGAQKGRWGSCSSAGNIRLNCRLLLLQGHLLEHVILHELCHLVHMDHSKNFKKLLQSVSPQTLQKDKELVRAWKDLPLWAILK